MKNLSLPNLAPVALIVGGLLLSSLGLGGCSILEEPTYTPKSEPRFFAYGWKIISFEQLSKDLAKARTRAEVFKFCRTQRCIMSTHYVPGNATKSIAISNQLELASLLGVPSEQVIQRGPEFEFDSRYKPQQY